MTDEQRLDWLEANSYAFLHRADTGKGSILLSRDHDSSPYGLRAAIDKAARPCTSGTERPKMTRKELETASKATLITYLESWGFACYDRETISELRTAALLNYETEK